MTHAHSLFAFMTREHPFFIATYTTFKTYLALTIASNTHRPIWLTERSAYVTTLFNTWMGNFFQLKTWKMCAYCVLESIFHTCFTFCRCYNMRKALRSSFHCIDHTVSNLLVSGKISSAITLISHENFWLSLRDLFMPDCMHVL
jgi:hypothetical protein